MTPYENAVARLADGLGMEIAVADDHVCEIAVEGRAVMLRPLDEEETTLTMFAPVATAPEGAALPAEALEKALAMDLFGSETLGGHIGLFVDALILSSPAIVAEGLDAETFAEKLLVFSRLAGETEQKLASPVDGGEDAGEATAPITGSGFIAV